MPLDFAKLRETRAAHPEKLAEIYASRTRRDVIQGDGPVSYTHLRAHETG
jgi:hypothetical protein